MQKTLTPHTLISDIAIEVTLNMTKSRLIISFDITGVLEKYIFPKEQMIKRENELWKASCFELFLANSKEEEYYELNFSPSLAWNFYYLKYYRAEVQEVEITAEPIVQIREDKNSYSIELTLEGFDFERFDSCNLTAILLTQEGERTFWSIQPMKGSPDFHHRDYFVTL